MIGSCELKARVEESLGTVLDPDFFGQAEQYARRKLDMCNERAGRKYGEMCIRDRARTIAVSLR